MSKISIKAMIDAYVAANPKTWEHDRTSTLGASECGACIRKAYFAKHAPDERDLKDDDYGAKVRGDLLERHLWVPAIEHAVRNSNVLALVGGGDSQTTYAAGFLSATPDGLLVGVERDCLAHLGVPDIGADCLTLECKTIDPRMKLLEPKPEHTFQCQVQMGLIREVTDYRPRYALLSYIDASSVSAIKEFAIRFDEQAYAAAKRRARQVFAADRAEDLPPEGRIEGGQECSWCDFADACGRISADAVPTDDRHDELDAGTLKTFGEMVMMEAAWRREKRNAERQLAAVQETIRQALREARTRRAEGPGWYIGYSKVAGRRSFDVKGLAEAARAAGIDVAQFERVGGDGDRLTVKTLGEEDDGE